MNKKHIVRILSVVINTIILFVGSIIAFKFSSIITSPSLISEILGVCTVIAFFIGLLICIVEIVSVFRISDSTFHTLLLSTFMLFCLLFSPDTRFLIAKSIEYQDSVVLDTLSNLSYVMCLISYISFFRYTYFPHDKLTTVAPLWIFGIICGFAFIPLSFINLQWIAHFVFLIAVLVYFIIYQIRTSRENTDDATFTFTSIGLFSICGMQTVNVLQYSKIINSAFGWSTIYVWLTMLCFISVYIAFSIRTDQKARYSTEYKQRAEKLRNKLLAQQIKPHFIFNSLSIIKSKYHNNLDGGDNAMGIFSDYLRECLSMIDKDNVSFSEEMENISRYIDFINISQTDKFNVIYDIEDMDFFIPPFSLQPFVENSIKYSQVNRKKDGFIMISSHNDGNKIILKIIDNGIGFDINKLKDGMYGIRNTCERIKLLTGNPPIIKSSINSGTEVIISVRRTN